MRVGPTLAQHVTNTIPLAPKLSRHGQRKKRPCDHRQSSMDNGWHKGIRSPLFPRFFLPVCHCFVLHLTTTTACAGFFSSLIGAHDHGMEINHSLQERYTSRCSCPTPQPVLRIRPCARSAFYPNPSAACPARAGNKTSARAGWSPVRSEQSSPSTGGADGSDRAQLVGGASMILSHVMLLALRPHSPPRAAARPAGRADQLLLREMVFCLLFCSLRAGRNHGLTRRLLVDEF